MMGLGGAVAWCARRIPGREAEAYNRQYNWGGYEGPEIEPYGFADEDSDRRACSS